VRSARQRLGLKEEEKGKETKGSSDYEPTFKLRSEKIPALESSKEP
jgi:hypothetical protein